MQASSQEPWSTQHAKQEQNQQKIWAHLHVVAGAPGAERVEGSVALPRPGALHARPVLLPAHLAAQPQPRAAHLRGRRAG